MFSGMRIKIEEEEYVIPPISLGQLRDGGVELLQQHDALVADGKTFEAMGIRGQIILSALRRNYPDFSEDKLFNWLDMGNTSAIWLAILGASGFTPGEVEAALATPGVKANGTLNLSTGA